MTGERRADVCCAVALVAVATLFFGDVLFGGNNFYFRDLYAYHLTLERIVRESLLRGELPLWNRFFANGQPLAANPAYEVFYPGQWLVCIGSLQFGFALHIVAHVWLALVGMYAMLRTMTLRLPAAAFGAVSFGLGGFFLGAITNLPTMLAWSWAPAIGWALIRLLRAPSPRRFAIAALTAAMPLLIAEPFALLQMAMIALVTLTAFLWGDRRPRLSEAGTGEAPVPPRGLLTALVALAALLVAAAQLLPMLDFVRDSARARGFAYEAVVDWSMPAVRPLELLAPRAFGIVSPEAHAYWGTRLFGARGTPYLVSIYAGVMAMILALAGWLARVRGARTAGALALVSYLLALGGRTPLFALLYRLDVHSLRYPEKFAAMGVFVIIVFAATVLEAIVLDGTERGDARVTSITRRVAWVVVMLLLAAAIAVWLLPLRPPLLARAAMLAALVIATGWAMTLQLPRRSALLLGAILLVADFGTLSRELVPRMPAAFFDRPHVVDALTPGATLFHRGDLAQQGEQRGYERVSPGWATRNALRPYTPAMWGLRTTLEVDFDETALAVTHDLLHALQRLGNSGASRWSEPFMTMAGVDYVLDYRPLPAAMREARGYPQVWRPLRIRRVPSQGRYFFATALTAARSEEELLAALRVTPDIGGHAFVPWPPFAPAPARVTRLREGARDAELDVESSGRALLVMSVTRDRHWRATIDGAPASLLPANVAFQALEVPAGRHHVVMQYDNPLVAIGMIISALALLAAAIAIAR
jgi:hypothetical protein